MNLVEHHATRPTDMLQHMHDYAMRNCPTYAVHFVAITALARTSAGIFNLKETAYQLFWELPSSTFNEVYDAWEKVYHPYITSITEINDYDSTRKQYRKV